MKLRKAKDNSNKVAVFMISDFGEAYNSLPAGTFITVPANKHYETLREDVGDLTRFADIDEFLQAGLKEGWFTIKAEADKIIDEFKLNSQFVECEVKYSMILIEQLYMTLNMKKAEDTLPDFSIKNDDSYLVDYKTKKVGDKEFIFADRWKEDIDKAMAFDKPAAEYILDLLQTNIKNMEDAVIIDRARDVAVSGELEMAVAKLMIDDKLVGYLKRLESGDCEIVEDIGAASWIDRDSYRNVWSHDILVEALNDLVTNTKDIKSAEILPEHLGSFDSDFMRYFDEGAECRNEAQEMWEAEHNEV